MVIFHFRSGVETEDSDEEKRVYVAEVLNERNEQVVESEQPIRRPFLSFMTFLPQKAIECLLLWHYDWFSTSHSQPQPPRPSSSTSPSTSTSASAACGLDHSNCLWIYSLLAVLQKPVSPDTVFTLRQLCRLCRQTRSVLGSEQPKDLAAVNLIILIISRYFDQLDLADDTWENGAD